MVNSLEGPWRYDATWVVLALPLKPRSPPSFSDNQLLGEEVADAIQSVQHGFGDFA